MTAQPSDIHELLKKIRYDLTAAQAKLTDAFAMLGELNLREQPAAICPVCGLEQKGARSLAEHVYHSHDGPVPEHWLAVEALAADPDEVAREVRERVAAGRLGDANGGQA